MNLQQSVSTANLHSVRFLLPGARHEINHDMINTAVINCLRSVTDEGVTVHFPILDLLLCHYGERPHWTVLHMDSEDDGEPVHRQAVIMVVKMLLNYGLDINGQSDTRHGDTILFSFVQDMGDFKYRADVIQTMITYSTEPFQFGMNGQCFLDFFSGNPDYFIDSDLILIKLIIETDPVYATTYRTDEKLSLLYSVGRHAELVGPLVRAGCGLKLPGQSMKCASSSCTMERMCLKSSPIAQIQQMLSRQHAYKSSSQSTSSSARKLSRYKLFREAA
jgi:hypothetical protein